MTTLTIPLPDSLKTFIDDQIATKGYGNVSEYFRTLLREAQAKEQDARLEALLLEGLQGEEGAFTPEDWQSVRQEALAQIKKARKSRS